VGLWGDQPWGLLHAATSNQQMSLIYDSINISRIKAFVQSRIL
jgi:hypothetical protein